MIVHPDFLDHWKTLKLIALTQEPTAPQMLLRLWGYCQIQKRSVFDQLPNLQSICRTNLTTETLKNHLIEAGFLRVGDKGEFIVHDWEQSNRILRNSWENGKKGGNPRLSNPRVIPREPHRLSHGLKSKEEENRKGGLTHGLASPIEEEKQISAEERAANHQKFAQLAGRISESLKSGDSSSQVEKL